MIVSRTETPYPKCLKIWTRFPSSEMRKRVAQVWKLRDLKPVPLQKMAQTGNFTLVNPKVSLCSARWGEPRSIRLSSKYNPASDSCRQTVTYTAEFLTHFSYCRAKNDRICASKTLQCSLSYMLNERGVCSMRHNSWTQIHAEGIKCSELIDERQIMIVIWISLLYINPFWHYSRSLLNFLTTFVHGGPWLKINFIPFYSILVLGRQSIT